MLALDLVQSGAAAQAVRDAEAAVQQINEIRAQKGAIGVVVAAFRELGQAIALWDSLASMQPQPGFVAVVVRSQRDAAQRYLDSGEWAGVAVRPVVAEELVGAVLKAARRDAVKPGHETRTGSLETESLCDLLGSLIERIPRPGAGKSAIVAMESQGRNAVIALVDGELLHAEVDNETGRHALERAAAWRRGTFRLDALPWRGQPTLSGSALSLLAVAQEYARRIEEARQSLPYSDCVCTVRWERVRPLPVVAEAMFRRIASGQVLADAIRGDGDDELEAFAALEARIKRGAVVPQVESAPRPAPVGPMGDLSLPPPISTSSPSSTRVSSGWTSTPMSLTEAPSMAERRRSHPTTNLYRLGSDGRTLPSLGDAGDAGAGLPGGMARTSANRAHSSPVPGKPVTPIAGTPIASLPTGDLPQATSARRVPTPLHNGAVLSGPANNMPRRPPSSLLSAGKVGAARQTDLGVGGVGGNKRTFGTTGWFGVGPPVESGIGTGDQGLDTRRPRSSVHLGDGMGDRLMASSSVRTTPLATSTPAADRVAARPYAWIPAAQIDDDPAPAEPPKPMVLLRPRNWPWVIAAAGMAAALAWLLIPRGPDQRSTAAEAAFLQAVALMDGGHGDEAYKQLNKLAADPLVPPEVRLHMAILDLDAKRFDAARAGLEAYIAHPLALHVDRAKKLYHQVFGAEPRQAAAAAR